MKSAVEWLVDYIENLNKNGYEFHPKFEEDLIEQAKEMFEQQIIDARQSGINAVINGKSISNIDYYNETFKSE
jgi:hypothetical protein